MTYETDTCVFYGCENEALERLLELDVYVAGKKIDDTRLAVCALHRAWLLDGIADASENGGAYDAGIVREAGEAYNPTAVRWWLIARERSGFVFSRGGREPTEESAQSELAAAQHQLDVERRAWRLRKTHELLAGDLVRRFSHELQQDGTLRPLVPTDWEVDE